MKSEAAELSDSDAWNHAAKKAWDIIAALQEAAQLAKKLDAEAKLTSDDQPQELDYDQQMVEALKEEAESKEEEEKDDDDEVHSISTVTRSKIDQVIFHHKLEGGEIIRDKNGCMILHVLSARIDRQIATAPLYADVFAFYLDMFFDRGSEDKATILLDVRGGEGFANPTPRTMLKFIRTVTRVLEINFPERLNKLILFPVPMLARGVFQSIKLLLDSKTVNKIELVSGPASRNAPLPKDALEKYIDANVLDLTESVRLGCFKVVEKQETQASFFSRRWK